MLDDPLIVVAKLAHVFDDLGIAYVVGGSLASSLYGIPRASQDVDLMADMRLAHVDPATRALEKDFYVAAEMISDAIRRRGSFNVIHLATMFKADIFIPREEAWSIEEMARAHTEEFQLGETDLTIRFASPEDTVLHKLLWYKLGGNVSDRQWNDVLGVLKVQGELLDLAYLERWAAILKVDDLLARASSEA